jgi:hypothetical protein
MLTRTSLSVLAAVLTLGLAAPFGSPATAATMSFSGLPGSCLGASPAYAEAGITATDSGFGPAYWARPGVLHMDDSGTFCPQSVTFATARPFDAVSVDILPLSSWYCADPGNCAATDPYDNVLWEGLVGDTVVASDAFFMGTTDSTYVFGEAFRTLDELRVSALRPDIARIGGECFDAPCAHFELDNLVLAPVPLPAAVWLFASGIGALAAAGGAFHRSRKPALRPTP